MRKKDAWVALHGFINNYTTTRQKKWVNFASPFLGIREEQTHTQKSAEFKSGIYF